MYNYFWYISFGFCFRNCCAAVKEKEKQLAKYIVYLFVIAGKGKKQKGRLKCECFCNGHCAYECPNFQIAHFESWYDLPASEVGLTEISCKDCRFYDKYMTCKDCYFQYCKECRFTNNFEKGC